MSSTSANTGAGTRPDVTLKLSQLQNLCKRDPAGYRSDYDAQVHRLRSECDILALSPSARPPNHLAELIQFTAAVCSSSYPSECDSITTLLVQLLLGQASSSSDNDNNGNGTEVAVALSNLSLSLPSSAIELHKDVRKSCVSALILMRNKGKLPPLHLLQLFFRIMAVIPDKGLREQLYKHIVNDIRNINKNGKREEKINRKVQGFLHKVVSFTVPSSNGGGAPQQPTNNSAASADVNDPTHLAAKRAIEMISELYRRKVWTDERTIAILATGVESIVPHVASTSMRFFLNIEEKMAYDEEREANDEWFGVQEINFHKHSKKCKKRIRQVGKQVKKRMKEQKKRELEHELETNDQGVELSKKLYPAIELLRDPQGLAESVMKRLLKTGGPLSYKFELKILAMNFLTRLVGNHELLLLSLYPFLRRYMGGHQRDVTAVLAYAVQACHDTVPPEEIHGLLQTIAHNFITERCSGEQIAVGINACRAICARVPSALISDDDNENNLEIANANNNPASTSTSSSVSMDTEGFARDLAGYAKHRDRSVAVAGRGWQNFIREAYPSLLAGKDRGKVGSALHRAGEKPLRYGETRIEEGVAGADLLVEYEAKKVAYLKERERRRAAGEDVSDEEDSEEDDGLQFEKMNDDDEKDNDDEKADSGENDDDEEEEEEEDDETAPELVRVKQVKGKAVPITDEDEEVKGPPASQEPTMDLSTMTPEEREKLKQDVSATRVFTASDFEKMRKLVEREERAKRDPRAAARQKRRRAQGKDFEELSDDDSSIDSDEEGRIFVKGAVNPSDIMAEARKKRANKVERLEKIVAGRDKFEHKMRDGGSTNEEKKRKKNFLMTKFSFANRTKQGSKETARRGTLKKTKKMQGKQGDSKRRRRV